jgi:hypothetical protein
MEYFKSDVFVQDMIFGARAELSTEQRGHQLERIVIQRTRV